MVNDNFDVLIRNATIIDGTRAPRFTGDLGIVGDRIARIGELGRSKAAVEIDAAGKVAAPGFIDSHTHDDRLLLSDRDMAPKVSQGVTTVVAGNCGVSLAPMPEGPRTPVPPPFNLKDDKDGWIHFPTFRAYVEALCDAPAATNCALLVGHTSLRVATMEDLDRPASAAQIVHMRQKVQEALSAGAIGVSTGLFYERAIAAPTEEVIEICRPLKQFNGLYCTHMRNEAEGVMASLDETFRIGREVGVPVVISHHKLIGVPNHGRSKETLAHIERAMREQAVCLDCYPYNASSTILTANRAVMATRVIVTRSQPLPKYAGMDLDTVAKDMGVSQEEAIKRLQPAGAIYFMMDDDDVRRILAFEHTMIGSDGLPHDDVPHPRLWGSFPRVLGHYGRELGLFPLETAVYKMTGLTARNFGLKDRGVLKEGAFADITLFDFDTVNEGGSFAKPVEPAKGIDTVMVNGAVVWRGGAPTGERPGRVLRRGDRQFTNSFS